jgi:PPOX class probable F420-dependent enzyme
MMPTLSPAQADFLRWARVARLASAAPDGSPHVVPVCPALDGDDVVVALMAGSVKLLNVGGDGRVALVVDDYREDWDANAGLMLRGRARFLDGQEWERARGLLYEKFTQYEHLAPIERDAIVSIAVEHAASWGV